MFTVEVDEAEGLMVAWHTAGGVDDLVRILREGERRLSIAPESSGRLKTRLLIVDADSARPGPVEREAVALMIRETRTPRVLALVTPSAIGRATLGVVRILRGAARGSLVSGFGTREEAFVWIEEHRPGARAGLISLHEKVDQILRRHRQPTLSAGGRPALCTA